MVGALAASKLHIPTAHIEAGERSFDRRMPEEINRLVADHLSDLHLCASHAAVHHLAAEGIVDSVEWTGDVMLDALMQNRPLARRKSDVLARLDLKPGKYSLVTIHRAGNTDDPARLGQIVQALNQVGETIIFPVHPRTGHALSKINLPFAHHIRLTDPAGYLDMMILEENARRIATDSGGVQREAYYLGIPCLTLRDETEWVETVEAGWNKLVGAEPERIIEAWSSFAPPAEHPPIYGDGTAAQRIADTLGSKAPTFGRLRRKSESAITSLVLPKIGVEA
jgi:UDP-N-acetylglucosamine 2-epimerase